MSFQRDASPQWTWINPANEQIVTSNSASLQWSVFDGNGATTLDLYYDTTGGGFSGTPIVAGLATTQGAMSYTWDMSGLPDGVYFVYARIRNGEYSDAIYGGSIRKLLDSDGDGMPDAWETAHGLDPHSAADAYLDPDGDGLSNLDEYLNGTDPHVADTDGGGESDLSEAVNGRDGTNPGDDVTSITLTSVAPGEGDSRGGEQVLVLGSGFQNGATVSFGGAVASQVTFVNSTRLVVTTPAHSLGTVEVTVANPGGSGSASKTGAFAFLCEFVEPPVAFSNAGSSPLCPGQNLQLGTSGLAGATFSWMGPNGFTSSLQNPTISQAGTAASGVYTVTMQVGSCSLQATTTATVSGPSAPTATNSGPVCAGQDVQLNAASAANGTWSWTGPGGFTSSSQSPVLPAAQPSGSGTYSVTVSVNGCASPAATTDLLVRARPTATVSGSQLVCPESSESIQATLTGEPPWALQWSDGVSQSGILASPTTRSVSPTADTTYSITSISDAHCGGTASGTAAITINGNCTMYHTVPPCRVADTRGPAGEYGGPALAGGTTRVFTIGGKCGIPTTAKAVSLNVTAIGATGPGHLRLYPGGDPLPQVSTLNFRADQTRANNAITRLGAGGTLAVFGGLASGGSVQVIVDVNGYFE